MRPHGQVAAQSQRLIVDASVGPGGLVGFKFDFDASVVLHGVAALGSDF